MEDSAPSASSLLSIWASMNSWFTPTVLFVFLNLMIGTILFTSNLPTYNHPHTHNKEDQKEKSPNQHQQNDLNQSKLARSPSILQRFRSFNLHLHRSQQDPSPATNHRQQQHEEGLEIAATQFVFNHPFAQEQDAQSVNSNDNDFDFDPTRFDDESDATAQYAAFGDTNEVRIVNAQTRFVYEEQSTVEKVTTHFDFDFDLDPVGRDNTEDTGFEETREEENDELQSLDEVYSKLKGGHVNRTMSDTQPASGEVPAKLPTKMKKSASLKSAFSHFEEEKIMEARRPATVRERRSAETATAEDDVEVDAKADDFINKFKNQLKLQRIDSIIRYKDMVSRGSAN